MKRRLIILAVAFVLASVAGCERKGQPDEPKAFDPKIDTPAAPFDVHYDPLLVANQSEVAKMSGKKRFAAGPVNEADSNEAIKQTVVALAKAAATKDPTQLTPFFADEEDVRTILRLDKALAELNEKGQALANLAKERLGVDLPPEIGLAQMQAQSGGIMTELSKLLENSKIEINNDETATVIDPNDPIKINALTFAQIEGAWKIQVQPMQKKFLSLNIEMIGGLSKSIDSLSAGILDNTITQDNLKAKAIEIITANIQPTVDKLQKVLVQAIAEAGEKPKSTAAPAKVAVGGGQNGPGYLDDVLALWVSDKKDEAAAEFVKIDWTKPPAFSEKSIFGKTADSYAALSDADRAKPGPYEDQLKNLRDMGRYLLDLAEKAHSAGDEDKVNLYTNAIENCAKFLIEPAMPKTVSGTGRTLNRILAEAKISLSTPVSPAPAAEPNAQPPAPPVTAPADQQDQQPAKNADQKLEEDANKDRGPDKAKEVRDTLLRPARRSFGAYQ